MTDEQTAGAEEQTITDAEVGSADALLGSGAPPEQPGDDAGLDDSGDVDAEVVDEPVEQPEPKLTNIGVVQDNVSEPGTQTTHTPDGTTEHTVEDANTPQAQPGEPVAEDDAEDDAAASV
jgi:hypothetical protein